ncbi:MAG: hypothetical protein R3252_07470 [Robiginitalea sp.]|nr:hypothetical protein [Robiginitalea sp.]
MKRYHKALLPVLLMVLFGCSDETTVYQDSLQEDVILENGNNLLTSVNFTGAGVLEIYEEASSISGKLPDQAGDYPLTLIASVDPPSYQSGDRLTASHVDVVGDYAYVGYNTVGDAFYGAIDVVDVSDPHNPRVTSRLFYLNADINALEYDNGFVYAVGGVDSETSVRATSNSFVARIPAWGGSLSTEGILYGFQQGYNATDVMVEADRILVSSGKEGSITAYDKADLAILSETYMADARALEATGGGIAALDAGAGVRLLDAAFGETGLIPISTNMGEATKKTMEVWDAHMVVAEAAKGAGMYPVAGGSVSQYLSIPVHPEGVASGDVVTNAVTANENILFMANGGAGLSLAEKEGGQARTVGIIELEGSINYVVSRGDYAFAASGLSGLQIIKLNRPSESLGGLCADLPIYNGSSKLNVQEGERLAFRGEKRFNNINIMGSLMLCGSWTVVNHVDVKTGATFQLFGSMAVGRNWSRRNIKVGENGLLQIEGDVTIYGDVILMEGATLEFLGTDSEINVFGTVKYEGEATVKGTFRDVRGKF